MNFTQEELDNEIWKQYKDTHYEVSNLGRYRNKITKYTSIGSIHTKGKKSKKNDFYLRFHFNGKYEKSHRVIYMVFNPDENIDNLLVHHINGIKTDNRIDNLQSIELKVHTSHHQTGEKHNNYKGIKGQFSKDGTLLNLFVTLNDMKNAGFLPRKIYGVIAGHQNIHAGYIFRRFPMGYVPIIGKKYDLYSPIFGYKRQENTDKIGQLTLSI